MPSFPSAIPAAYADNEILASAYRQGWNNGNGIACHNVPELGAKVFSESLGRVTVDAENIRDVHESACFEAEIGARDFSPFEFTAREFNDLGEGDDASDTPSADEAWEAYEEGVADSIRADLAEYTDEDYGIPKEEGEAEGEEDDGPAVNLDGIADTAELREISRNADLPLPVRSYALAKAGARDARDLGKIVLALQLEKQCDDFFAQIPAAYRW